MTGNGVRLRGNEGRGLTLKGWNWSRRDWERPGGRVMGIERVGWEKVGIFKIAVGCLMERVVRRRVASMVYHAAMEAYIDGGGLLPWIKVVSSGAWWRGAARRNGGRWWGLCV